MTATSPLQADLWNHAISGVCWEPPNRPEIPAEWIRELVVSGEAGEGSVHAKGVRVRGVAVMGVLDLEHATLRTPLVLTDIDADQPINMEQAKGTWISIADSRITGLSADQLRLDHSLVLSGTQSRGEVRLGGARIGGDLSCSGGKFHNPDSCALYADHIDVAGSVYLKDGFEAVGEVRFLGASIGRDLDCSRGKFKNPNGDALSADGMRVSASVFLDEFEADGNVRFPSAQVGNRFSWQPARLGESTVVDLRTASVGFLADAGNKWPTVGRLRLGGFEYQAFTGSATWDVVSRLDWIGLHQPFHSQPYEQLAITYSNAGRSADARKVGIAKEQARNKALSGRTKLARIWRRLWHGLWGGTTRYGYRPAHALYWFAALLILAALFYTSVAGRGAMVPTNPTSKAVATVCDESDRYPCYQPMLYAIDVMVPVVDLGQRDAWTAHPAIGGEQVRIVTVCAIIFGWALTAAFIAAVGQTIRRRS